jgi:hypothetical protein
MATTRSNPPIEGSFSVGLTVLPSPFRNVTTLSAFLSTHISTATYSEDQQRALEANSLPENPNYRDRYRVYITAITKIDTRQIINDGNDKKEHTANDKAR